ncbi:GNAT family N-acetyltransferase [Pseudoteredinibacter isoporae]|uniref:Ribosomal protein S18 acetylase RimI-like enzyme n=1 Tax=Pseudoteredinibacter isoporae TaxID=570281 RepID=A0A7X0JQ66_9GAMM|nr:GNAT family N-acetyltransferase [Pseudoteredinibacter isoporae]MBB6519824.1 ribosomal protein S18 acetylase RimI-like enzyme [Pseudoteredinibacter isoporae]NHO85404.1 GNAT family N-acetyltransferase [Pseudoteredinibacter isoporae]NIB26144.1 GNAT family N-acetyltransferase [Pseudoteredinibacter isoporae]
MQDIAVIEADKRHSIEVAGLVSRLLIELEPGAEADIKKLELQALTESLLNSGKIWAFLARSNGSNVGVLTLHECAAIYAGGVFGEISELYVAPEVRSLKVGQQLIEAAMEKARALCWKRLEVGTPPENESPRTLRFYKSLGFVATGVRMKYVL